MSAKITLFSAPKAFVGHIGVIQENAIRSWLAFGNDVDVILLGNDMGVKEFAERNNIRWIGALETNQYGTPLVSSIMESVAVIAKSKYLGMINADIILPSNFRGFIELIPSLPDALYVGLRSDLDVTKVIDFNCGSWSSDLLELTQVFGTYRKYGSNSFNGADFYIYPQQLYSDVPDFALGRFFWDSWLIFNVLQKGRMVVDITYDFPVIHQNHSYSHITSGPKVDFYKFWENPELLENFRLLGSLRYLMGPREASYSLRDKKIVPSGKNGLRSRMRYNAVFYAPLLVRSKFIKFPVVSRALDSLISWDDKKGGQVFTAQNALRDFLESIYKGFPPTSVIRLGFRTIRFGVRNLRKVLHD